MEKLAQMVHPEKGVLFSPYSHIELEKHKVFTKESIKKSYGVGRSIYLGRI